MFTSQRKKKNIIDKNCDSNGVFHLEQAKVGALFSSFYAQLFTTSNPTCID